MKTLTLFALTGVALCSLARVAGAQQASSGPAPPAVHAVEQEETLLSRPVQHGGFGGPMTAYTRVNGEDSVLVGGRGGWLINHRLVIGGGGWGVANDLSVPRGAITDPRNDRLTFGYGGFWTEYILAPMRLVHGSVGALIGAGGLTYQRSETDDETGSSDAVFVVEPNVSAEVNVTHFMRLAVFASYRFVRGVELSGLDDGEVSGFAAGTMLKFGKF